MPLNTDSGRWWPCRQVLFLRSTQEWHTWLNAGVLTVFVLLLHRLLHWWHPAVFGDTRLAVASYCKIWNRFPNNYGKQSCEWFVNAELIISVSCIYWALIPGLSDLPYLLLEIINHFIIVFIFSSFSFSSKLSKKKKKRKMSFPWNCSTLILTPLKSIWILPPASLTADSCSLTRHFEAHKGCDDSAKNGGAESETVTFICNISNHIWNPPGREIKYYPNHLTLSGPT